MQDTENASSIINYAEEYIDALTAAHDSTKLEELIIHFRNKSTPPPNQTVLLPALEAFTAHILLLLAEYTLLSRKHPLDNQGLKEWLIRCSNFEKILTHFRQKTGADRFFAHMQCYKILSLICVMKSHVQLLAKKEPYLIVSSVYQFAYTLQEYMNYETFVNAKLVNLPGTPALYFQASFLFYNDRTSTPKNNWCKIITKIINHTIAAIMVGAEFSEEDVDFLGYVVGCLADQKPIDPRKTKHMVKLDFTLFQKNILADISKGLQTGNHSVSQHIQSFCSVFGRLKFLHTQLQSNECRMLIVELNEISTKLRLYLPYLLLQQYFSQSAQLYHLGVDPLIYTEYTENGMLKTLFQRLCISTAPNHLHELITYSVSMLLSDDVDAFLIKQLYLYLIMDLANNKKPFQDNLAKFALDEKKYNALEGRLKNNRTSVKEKMAIRFKIFLKMAIDTLKILFSENANKKDVVVAFLDEAKIFFADWQTLCFPMVFFLVCKKALELNDPALTDHLHTALDNYYYTVSGLPRSAQKKKKLRQPVETDNASIDQLLESINPDSKKKKPKGGNTVRSKAKNKKKLNTGVAKNNVTEDKKPDVGVTEIRTEPEPTQPSPTTPSPPDTESEESKVPTATKIIAALSKPKPAVSLGAYLKKNKQLKKYVSYESVDKQNEDAKIKTRSPFNPLQILMTLFNANANGDNQFKFALFLFGSAQHRQRYFSYPVFANDIDFRANCTFEELETFLRANEIDYKFILHPVYGKHPIIKIEFTEDPSVLVDIAPMRNEENRALPLHTLIKQLQAITDFPENSVFSTIVDDEEVFIDTQGGLSCLKEKDRQLQLVTHAHEGDSVPLNILRAIRFLAKCPDYKLHATLLTWIQDNKTTLSTAKDSPFAITVSHAFLKMLYSGRAARCLTLLRDLGPLKTLCPELNAKMSGESEARFIAWVETFDAEQSQCFQQRSLTDYANVCREILKKFEIKLDALDAFLNNSLWKSSSTIYTSHKTHTGEQNGIREQDRRSDFSLDDPK